MHILEAFKHISEEPIRFFGVSIKEHTRLMQLLSEEKFPSPSK